jgi:hypothetical protein
MQIRVPFPNQDASERNQRAGWWENICGRLSVVPRSFGSTLGVAVAPRYFLRKIKFSKRDCLLLSMLFM